MIGHLSGKVLHLSSDSLLIDVGGIGYEVHVPARAAEGLQVGAIASFYIYTHLRADGRSEAALELFGFQNPWEKQVFLTLTSVSGVGFRTALGMFNALSPDVLMTAIFRQDRGTLTSAPGIGKKTAERLIVELSEKAQKLMQSRGPISKEPLLDTRKSQPVKDSDSWEEAQTALLSLGYKDVEASAALRKVFEESEGQDLTVQTFVTKALKHLGRGRVSL